MTDATGGEALRAAERVERGLEGIRQDLRRLEDRTTPLATFKAHETTSDREFVGVRKAVADVAADVKGLRASLEEWREESAQADLEAARRESKAMQDAATHRDGEAKARKRFILTLAMGLPATMLATATLVALIVSSMRP